MDKMTRRDLLKAIVAGSGGIVAAGFLPEKWLKPVVKSGVLPVHAQASAPTPGPTQTPDYIQGDYYETGDGQPVGILAFAFVSSQPIPAFNNSESTNSLSSTKVGVEFPVEGKDVTLFVDDVIESTKKTDADGYVEWDIEWELQQPTSINPNIGATLRFEIDGGTVFDVVEVLPWA